MIVKRNTNFETGIPYVCKCKLIRKYYDIDGTRETYYAPQRIYHGPEYEDVTIENKLKKAVADGTCGDKLRVLLAENPLGWIDNEPDLYICSNCGYWVNEERLSFEVLEEDAYSTKGKKTRQYRKIYSHKHICPICSMRMKPLDTPKTGDVFDDWAEYEKSVYELHLTCPSCHEKITILRNSGNPISKGYYLYDPNAPQRRASEEIKKPVEWVDKLYS